MINVKDLRNPECFEEHSIVTLETLQNAVEHFVRTCRLNKKDPAKVPVIVKDSSSRRDYILSGSSLAFGKGLVVSLDFYGNDKDRIDYFEGKDEQPEGGGEFWKSRGPSDWDCSGFVVSKEAGERLLQMVQLALGRVMIKSFLDWREFEPNWIQFKFSAEEFDVEKLDRMSRDNNGVLTDEIIEQCVKPVKA